MIKELSRLTHKLTEDKGNETVHAQIVETAGTIGLNAAFEVTNEANEDMVPRVCKKVSLKMMKQGKPTTRKDGKSKARKEPQGSKGTPTGLPRAISTHRPSTA